MEGRADGRGTLLEAFAHTLDELAATAARISEEEEAKAKAASLSEHRKMDSFIKQEQALILELRGFEQQRQQQAARLGWEGLTFRAILDQADAGEEALLAPRFDALGAQLKRLRSAQEDASRIIAVRLREFEHILGTGKPGGAVPDAHFHERYV